MPCLGWSLLDSLHPWPTLTPLLLQLARRWASRLRLTQPQLPELVNSALNDCRAEMMQSSNNVSKLLTAKSIVIRRFRRLLQVQIMDCLIDPASLFPAVRPPQLGGLYFGQCDSRFAFCDVAVHIAASTKVNCSTAGSDVRFVRCSGSRSMQSDSETTIVNWIIFSVVEGAGEDSSCFNLEKLLGK